MKKFTLGIIGAGNMAQSILNQIALGKMDAYLNKNDAELEIRISDSSIAQLEKVSKICPKAITSINNDDTIFLSDYILFAIKPQNSREVLSQKSLADKTIISIMAGVNIATIKELSHCKKVVRIMPNLNAKIGESFNAYDTFGIDAVSEGFIVALLTSFGSAVKVPESNMNAVTGLSGSGPAFVFMFLKAFISTAKKHGFSEEVAKEIATKTIIGSAINIANTDSNNINTLIDSVCSKGGTTIEGVNFLRDNDFENIVSSAIEKAINRAKELEKGI